MRGPGDVSALARAFDAHELDPQHVVALLGKTEGNGGVNDFTREFAHRSFAALLGERLGVEIATVEERVAIIMSGGTEGVLTPHLTVFARVPDDGVASSGKRLTIGIAHTRTFLPEEIGRSAQITETSRAVLEAMSDAGIVDPSDVHFVQIKCPLLTAKRVEEAKGRGSTTATDEAYASMGYSRGASAIGVALALGEVERPVSDADVLRDWTLSSDVASTSAGIELMRNVVIVMGNAAGARGSLVIAHSVMRDAIDLAGAAAAFTEIAPERIVNVFAKAEASPDGMIRGERHTMLDDTDISSTRHARAAVGGLLAGLARTGAIYVSGGAEHQGPPGGGPVAVIAEVGNGT